jgi:hypothetical protein
MISFVDICALSINVLGGSKWKTFKTVAKVALFDNDSGVNDELEKFRRLVGQHGRISDAVTLEQVLKGHGEMSAEMEQLNSKLSVWGQQSEQISEGVELLVKAETDRNAEKKETERIAILHKALLVKSESDPASNKAISDFSEAGVEKSGNWIEDIDEYKSWADLDSKDNSLLFLSGGVHSGKTYLVSAIVQKLQSYHRKLIDIPTRTSIAYYYFPQRDKKPDIDGIRDSQLPVTAIKSMAIQIAKQNTVYAKEMVRLWENKESSFRDITCKEICNKLQLLTYTKGAAFILLFDGLDQLSERASRELFETLVDAPKNVRIIFSGSSESLERLKSVSAARSVVSIAIEEHNVTDIERYVDRKLKTDDLLQDTETETLKLKTSIKEGLAKLAAGNFGRAQRIVERIKEAISADKSAEDITALLQDDSFEDGTTIAKNITRDLNASLNAQEIEQLSVLLIWGMYGNTYFTVDDLKVALFLHYDRTPLQPLEQKLIGKYAKVFTIKEDKQVMVNYDISTMFKATPTSRLGKGLDGKERSDISMTVTINHVDSSTVRRFFWDLSENTMFHKFPFDNLQDSRAEKINSNPVDAHLTISKQCFKLILSEPDSKTKCLVPYAVRQILSHLESLQVYADSGVLDSSEKTEIIQSLVSLLYETDSIKKHWDGSEAITAWLDSVDTIQAWLRYPEARNLSIPTYRSWVENCLKSPNPGLTSLRDIMCMAAKQWLCESGMKNVYTYYRWVNQFMNLVSFTIACKKSLLKTIGSKRNP